MLRGPFRSVDILWAVSFRYPIRIASLPLQLLARCASAKGDSGAPTRIAYHLGSSAIEKRMFVQRLNPVTGDYEWVVAPTVGKHFAAGKVLESTTGSKTGLQYQACLSHDPSSMPHA
jgi:hypothetical protein